VQPNRTVPSIHQAQQDPARIDLLKAQSVAYTRAKKTAVGRTVTLVSVAAAASLTAACVDDQDTALAVSVIGLVLSLVALLLTTVVGARHIRVAVAAKEQFDTEVYQLSWNVHAVPAKPSPHEVALLADRYRGDQFDRPWYPDTESAQRPLDILICQQSNLGWGTVTHRRWAWTLGSALTLAVATPTLLYLRGDLSGTTYAQVVLLPWATLAYQGFSEVTAHALNSREKAEAQTACSSMWQQGLVGDLDEGECRQLQDRLVGINSRNALVPDWFDKHFRASNEAAMQRSAASLVAEARRAVRD
jgi:hypothetical protein